MPALQSAMQFGIPGGPELLIIVMILFMFALPAVIAVLVVLLLLNRRTVDPDRITDLERRVEALESKHGE